MRFFYLPFYYWYTKNEKKKKILKFFFLKSNTYEKISKLIQKKFERFDIQIKKNFLHYMINLIKKLDFFLDYRYQNFIRKKCLNDF